MAPKTYTLDEVSQNNDGKSCWIVVHDKVYDVTKFLEEVRDRSLLFLDSSYFSVLFHF